MIQSHSSILFKRKKWVKRNHHRKKTVRKCWRKPTKSREPVAFVKSIQHGRRFDKCGHKIQVSRCVASSPSKNDCTVDGNQNPVNSPVEVGSLSHYSQGFVHPRWWTPDFWTINSIHPSNRLGCAERLVVESFTHQCVALCSIMLVASCLGWSMKLMRLFKIIPPKNTHGDSSNFLLGKNSVTVPCWSGKLNVNISWSS